MIKEELERKKPMVKYCFTFGEFEATEEGIELEIPPEKEVYMEIKIDKEESGRYEGDVEEVQGKISRI